jgi:hypothetical protein
VPRWPSARGPGTRGPLPVPLARQSSAGRCLQSIAPHVVHSFVHSLCTAAVAAAGRPLRPGRATVTPCDGRLQAVVHSLDARGGPRWGNQALRQPGGRPPEPPRGASPGGPCRSGTSQTPMARSPTVSLTGRRGGRNVLRPGRDPAGFRVPAVAVPATAFVCPTWRRFQIWRPGKPGPDADRRTQLSRDHARPLMTRPSASHLEPQ